MAKQTQLKPTETELEILIVLWDKGEATVREVHNVLTKTRSSGYTTTLKLMQIMYEKGLVKRDDRTKTHVYKPAVNRYKIQKAYLNKMIKGLFAGSSGELALQAMIIKKPTQDEVKDLKNFLAGQKK